MSKLATEEFKEDYTEECTNEKINSKYDIDFEIVSFSVRDIQAMVNRQNMILPSFQRKNSWSNPKKSLFIDSLLLGLPIPNIILYSKGGKQFIIDGGHRIRSITEYMNNQFNISTSESNWKGKKFDSLDSEDRYDFESYKISTIIFKEVDPSSGYSVYEVFNRINTNSSPLSQQEIRNVIYDSQFLSTLKEEVKKIIIDKFLYDDDITKYKEKFEKEDKETDIVSRYLSYSWYRNLETEVGKSKSGVIAEYMDHFTKTINSPDEQNDCALSEIEKFKSNLVKFERFKKPFYWPNTNTTVDLLIESFMISVEKLAEVPIWINDNILDEIKIYLKKYDQFSKATSNYSSFEFRINKILEIFNLKCIEEFENLKVEKDKDESK